MANHQMIHMIMSSDPPPSKCVNSAFFLFLFYICMCIYMLIRVTADWRSSISRTLQELATDLTKYIR